MGVRGRFEKIVEPPKPSDQTTLKCYRCFKSDVTRVCHHCGRYMCNNCEPWPVRWLRCESWPTKWPNLKTRPFRWLRRLRLDRLFLKDHEFSDLYPLEKKFHISSASHCHDHIHYEESLINLFIWLIGIIGTVLILSAWLGPFDRLLVWSGLFLVMCCLFLLPVRPAIYRLVAGDYSTQFWPVFPRYELKITEALEVNFFVTEQIGVSGNGNGRSESTGEDYLCRSPGPKTGQGTIEIQLLLSPEDYKRYRQAGKPRNGKQLLLSAGYLGLKSMGQVKFNGGMIILNEEDAPVGHGPAQVHHSGRLHLWGKMSASEYEKLDPATGILKFRQNYEVQEKAGLVGQEPDKEFIFWILPRLEVAGRELVLCIYVQPDFDERLVLEEFSLTVPPVWQGQIDRTNGILDYANWQITWPKQPLSSSFSEANELRVRLATPVQKGIEFQCRYKVSIDKYLLSKLQIDMDKKKLLWYANGVPLQSSHKRMSGPMLRTEISGQVKIQTSVFKLQREHTIEDGGKQDYRRPDHLYVGKIVDALKDCKVDIKSVIETPARIGEVRDEAQLWEHYWEISGRLYIQQRLRHVQVHVIVYGQENQTRPENQEYVRWRLYLRSDLPVDYDEDYRNELQKIHAWLVSKVRKRLAVSPKHKSQSK